MARKKDPMAKKVKVLLLKPLPPRGNAGDIIDVKIHYAAQVLIPKEIAIVYSKQVQNQRASQMKKVEKNKIELQKHIVDMITSIKKDNGITFIKNATETGSLYDSISHKTIAQYIEDTYKVRLNANCFILKNKIEELGEFTVQFSYENIKDTFEIHVISDKGEQEVIKIPTDTEK